MDFVTGLVIGLIVGWSLNWMVQPLFRQLGRRRAGATGLNEALADLTVRLEAVEQAAFSQRPRLITLADQEATARVILKDRDPLETVAGIGPVYARRFYEAGVYTFQALADLSPREALQIVDARDWQNLDAEAWIRQAAALAQDPRVSPAGE